MNDSGWDLIVDGEKVNQGKIYGCLSNLWDYSNMYYYDNYEDEEVPVESDNSYEFGESNWVRYVLTGPAKVLLRVLTEPNFPARYQEGVDYKVHEEDDGVTYISFNLNSPYRVLMSLKQWLCMAESLSCTIHGYYTKTEEQRRVYMKYALITLILVGSNQAAHPVPYPRYARPLAYSTSYNDSRPSLGGAATYFIACWFRGESLRDMFDNSGDSIIDYLRDGYSWKGGKDALSHMQDECPVELCYPYVDKTVDIVQFRPLYIKFLRAWNRYKYDAQTARDKMVALVDKCESNKALVNVSTNMFSEFPPYEGR